MIGHICDKLTNLKEQVELWVEDINWGRPEGETNEQTGNKRKSGRKLTKKLLL